MIEKHLLVTPVMAQTLEKWKRAWGVSVNSILRSLIREEIHRRRLARSSKSRPKV